MAVIIAGLFGCPPVRTVMWLISLIWMGMACILNSRRCGRIHCRYTGPNYLAMIAPVLVFASGVVSAVWLVGLLWGFSSLAAACSFGGPRNGPGEFS